MDVLQRLEGLCCPECGFKTPDVRALFCRHCGIALGHPCPSCKHPIPTSAMGVDPVTECPECMTPLVQCTSCKWIAPPGTPRCENPACPEGSLMGRKPMAAVFGGDAGRTSFHRISREFISRQNAATDRSQCLRGDKAPEPRRVELPASQAAIVPVHKALVAVASSPGRVFRIALGVPTPSATKFDLSFAPKTHLFDCVAAFGDRLFVLHQGGAAVLSVPTAEGYTKHKAVSGEFCAQVVTEQGWLLVEQNGSQGVVVHRRAHDGNPLNGAEPQPVEPRTHPEWALPVADSSAAYMLDDRGCVWQFPWDGSPASRIAETEDGHATLMHAGNALFVLPVGADRRPWRVDLQTGKAHAAAIERPRLPHAAAADLRDMTGRLWLGLTATDGILGVSIAQPAQRPVPVSSPTVAAHHLAVIADAKGEGLLLGLTEGDAGYKLRGWWLDQEHQPVLPMEPPHPRAQQCSRGPHLAIADGYACVWYCKGNQTTVFLYELR